MSDEKAESKKPVHPARKWWRSMTGWPSGHNADRGSLAKLRRCRAPNDILAISAAFSLIQRLPPPEWVTNDRFWEDRVAVLAVVLSHIRDDESSRRAARSIGRKSLSDEESALLSEGRFRRLLQSEGNQELLTNFVRLVRHMKGKANVEDMTKTILYWGDGTRRRWAFDYYATGSAAPNDDDTQDTEIEEARS